MRRRTGRSKFLIRASVAFVVLWNIVFTGGFLAAQTQQESVDETVALLETRVRWDRGFLFFPANDARFYHAGYSTDAGRIEVYVLEPGEVGIPPAGSGEPLPTVCLSSALTSFDRIVEAATPQPSYRIFLRRVSREETGEGIDGDEIDSEYLCAFASTFIESFEFFRRAAEERGRALSFSGGVAPEFPAVLDVTG